MNDPRVKLYLARGQCGTPNCPVRAHKYYLNNCLEELTIQSSGRADTGCSLLLSPKVGKELSSAAICQWICNTILEVHAAAVDW